MDPELATNPEEQTPPPEVAPPQEIDAPVDPDSQEQPDDTEEIEFDGAKHRIPKALKPAFMMNADYTKKTQETAELKRTYEANKKALEENAKAIREDIQEHGRLTSIDERLAEYQRVNWDAYYESDPITAQRHEAVFTRLQIARQELVRALQSKHAQRTQDAAAHKAKLVEESRRTLAKEIPNWSPKIEQDLTMYAGKLGFDAEEVKEAVDTNPRAVKVLHLAYLGQQLIEQQRRQARPEIPAEPAKQVGARTSPSSAAPSDKDSTEVWMEKERKRLARKAAS